MTAEEMRNCTIASIKRLEREELEHIAEKIRLFANKGELNNETYLSIKN